MPDVALQRTQVIDAASDTMLLREAYRLRYAVTVDELQKNNAEADHARREIRDELDDSQSTVLCAISEGAVVGTIRVTWGSSELPQSYRQHFSLAWFGKYPLATMSFTSRLAIHKDFRDGSVIGQLFDHAYALIRERSSRVNFCHCTPALVRLYEQLGYRRYAQAVVDPDHGFQIPMAMQTEDANHLERVRSPLLKIARRYHNKPDSDDWFGRQFPEYAMGGVHAGLIDEEFVRSLAEEMFQTEIPLFRGLAPAAAEKFIAASRVVTCKPGDYVVKRGDVGHEMYLILSGAVEVRRDVDGRSCTIATLGKGQIFGEMAFVSNRARTASVAAITNLEVLVLTQQFIQSLTRTMPATVIQILLNLSVILCDRLNLCTEQLIASGATKSPEQT